MSFGVKGREKVNSFKNAYLGINWSLKMRKKDESLVSVFLEILPCTVFLPPLFSLLSSLLLWPSTSYTLSSSSFFQVPVTSNTRLIFPSDL